MIQLRAKILLISFFVVLTLAASGVTDAEKYYRAGDWAVADSLYAQLLKKAPGNRIYNHRYGVCLCEQRKNLVAAEKHLLRSKRAGISLSAFYLGRVCFLQYKFDDAVAYYNFFMAHSNDKEKKATANECLSKCEQGKELLQRTEDVTIIDRVEVNEKDFFKNYNISKEAGTFFNSAIKIEEDSLAEVGTIYMTERGDRAFFAVLEADGSSNLYSKNRLLDHWSDKTSLGENINTEADEAYPFLMSDGIKLYFSSKGHNSFGGYDIFVTRYNASQNTYLPPQQLGMPFNSLGNDILYVVDEYNNLGWFASDRDCEEGNIAIYTFKPNATIKLLDTDNEDVRIKAAMIRDAVIDTGLNIEEEEPTVNTSKPELHKRAISFVVNDTLIYSSLDDFISEEAQGVYLQYEKAATDFDSIFSLVSEKRVLYSRTVDSDDKANLISDIMQMEDKCYRLEEERDRFLLSTRRLELETIRANGGYTKRKSVAVSSPEKQKEEEDEHVSPWETTPVAVEEEKITTPFFYNKTLYKYYEQVYSDAAIEKLVRANQMKTEAGNKQFLADYVIREYNKPEPEETFFEKIFSYDTTLTPQLTQNEMIAKVKKISNEGAISFVEANYLSFYTLKGQNVLLMENADKEQCREQMRALMDRAAFSFQQADQKIYVSDGVYTTNKQSLAQGNNFLKESIQLLEATTLTYLKHLYMASKEPVAEKPIPLENTKEIDSVVVVETVVEEDTLTRTEIAPQEIKQEITQKSVEEYRIQFGIFSRILDDSEIDLPDLTHLKYPDKSIYKYYTGRYATPLDAAMGLEEVKAKGFKDAYVVKFINGVPER